MKPILIACVLVVLTGCDSTPPMDAMQQADAVIACGNAGLGWVPRYGYLHGAAGGVMHIECTNPEPSYLAAGQ